MVDMFKFDDKLIQNIRINQSRARLLKNLKKKIEKEAGVYVRETIDAARPPEPPRAYIWYEDSSIAPVTRVLARGDTTQPTTVVDAETPTILGGSSLDPEDRPLYSTGRRLALARWMTSPQNPLVARVMVNRIWQWYFGEGLVASENDFGVVGERPTHPKLLNYLATEFIESGWSIKHMHRLIANSATFQLSSAWDDASGRLDAENRLLWRWRSRRLAAETVRDSMLAVGGAVRPGSHRSGQNR